MQKTFRAIRQLERFLFRGVPEHPEGVWQRDGHGSIDVRPTGKPLPLDRDMIENDEDDELFANIIYGEDTVEVTRVN